jgi:hypothetical protein
MKQKPQFFEKYALYPDIKYSGNDLAEQYLFLFFSDTVIT